GRRDVLPQLTIDRRRVVSKKVRGLSHTGGLRADEAPKGPGLALRADLPSNLSTSDANQKGSCGMPMIRSVVLSSAVCVAVLPSCSVPSKGALMIAITTDL